MNDEQLLIAEVEKEAKNARALMNNEVVLWTQKLLLISLDDFNPKVSHFAFSNKDRSNMANLYTKELLRRAQASEDAFKKKINRVNNELKLMKIDVVRKALEKYFFMSDFIIFDSVNIPNLLEKEKLHQIIRPLFSGTPGTTVFSELYTFKTIDIKKACEKQFKSGIEAIQDEIIEAFLKEFDNQINIILEAVKNYLADVAK